MHLDEVAATALINLVCDKEGISRPEVHRVNARTDVSEFQADNIVYDIGGGDFDHHQEDKPVRENGIPYAAFGQVFDVVGTRVFGESVAKAINDNFVLAIDECDNTAKDTPIYAMIRTMNPYWNESRSLDDVFAEAVSLIERALKAREIVAEKDSHADLTVLMTDEEKHTAEIRQEASDRAIAEAEGKIQKAMRDADVVASGDKTFGIMHLDVPGIPYPSILKAVEGTNIAAYTFPQRGGVSLKPLNRDSVSVPVPDRWKGASEFDVEGLTFCHPAGISLSFDTAEHAEAGFTRMVEEAYPREFDKENTEIEQENPYEAWLSEDGTVLTIPENGALDIDWEKFDKSKINKIDQIIIRNGCDSFSDTENIYLCFNFFKYRHPEFGNIKIDDEGCIYKLDENGEIENPNMPLAMYDKDSGIYVEQGNLSDPENDLNPEQELDAAEYEEPTEN
jgi:uncharacterized UPF0160 family protein